MALPCSIDPMWSSPGPKSHLITTTHILWAPALPVNPPSSSLPQILYTYYSFFHWWSSQPLFICRILPLSWGLKFNITFFQEAIFFEPLILFRSHSIYIAYSVFSLEHLSQLWMHGHLDGCFSLFPLLGYKL